MKSVNEPAPRGVTCELRSEKIYSAYPRHVGRLEALKAIERATRRLMKAGHTEASAEAYLLDAAQTYATSDAVRRCARCFIPHPATWFNQGRYDDDRSEWGIRKVNTQEPCEEMTREELLALRKKIGVKEWVIQ